MIIGVGALALLAQTAVTAPPLPALGDRVPFEVGESLEYSAKLGFIRLGTAYMSVEGIDTVRGRQAYHFRFRLSASAPFFKVDDVIESWTGTADFISYRFRKDHNENEKQTLRHYEIFPDSGYFRENAKVPEPTVLEPLDDAAFLFFVRSLPLEVGQTYTIPRYFRNDKNPLVIKVLKRETMELPDGTKVPCIVLHPTIDDRGMFEPRAEARLWLTDDSRRIPVQIRSKYPFGTVTLRLEKLTLRR